MAEVGGIKGMALPLLAHVCCEKYQSEDFFYYFQQVLSNELPHGIVFNNQNKSKI